MLRIRNGWGQLVVAAAMAGILATAVSTAGAAPRSKKMNRQIEFFEEVTSGMLVDSPNFLVYSSSPARGLYLEEYGLLITFDASLVENQEEIKDWWKNWSNGIRIEKKDGSWIIHTDEDEDEDEDEREKDREKRKETLRNYERWQDERAAMYHQLYEDGKEEMIQHLLDWGDTVRQLQDDQWVTMVAYLTRAEFFEEQNLSQLVVKAKMRDLRSYAEGELSEDQAREKVIVEEY